MALLIIVIIILLIFNVDVPGIWNKYIVPIWENFLKEPVMKTWNFFKEFVTGESFSGLKEKLDSHSTIPAE